MVPAQTTSFKPGPIVGELQHAGFPAAIEKGKVVLKKDVTIVKAGQTISREVAGLLTRLDILPLEVGLESAGRRRRRPRSTLRRSSRSTWTPAAPSSCPAYRRALGLARGDRVRDPEHDPAPGDPRPPPRLALAVAAGYPTKDPRSPRSSPRRSAARRRRSRASRRIEQSTENTEVRTMEYVYGALLLNAAGKPIDEKGLTGVLTAAGVSPDTARVKALLASLEGVNLDRGPRQGRDLRGARRRRAAAPEKKDGKGEKKEEEKKEEKGVSEEEAAEGLSALFG